MSKKPAKKKHYCPQNAIHHPRIGYFDSLVRSQTALNDLKKRVQESRHGYTEGVTGSTRDRFNAVQLVEAIEQGTHPTCGPADLEFLADLFTKKIAVHHKFKALGVELSPDGKPMLEGNICIDLQDGKGIGDAVATAKQRRFPIVSRNVWGQLHNGQRRELSEVDNIHQYSVEPRARVQDSNPTGVYPCVEDDSGIGITYAEQPGVNRMYHFVECSYAIEVTEIVQPSVVVDIGEELSGEYGIGVGRFEVSSSGVVAIGPLPQGSQGMSDNKVRQALEPFKQRDSVGLHATTADLVGPVSKKVDGIFVKMVASKGNVEFKFRNGRRWISGEGECSFNMTAAFELVNFDGKVGELYCLYVEKFRGNYIPIRKDVQDYVRTRFEISVKFKPGVVEGGEIFHLHTIANADNLPSDGIVVHTCNKQFFYKENNTVDITRFLADKLEENHGIKVYRKEEMKPGLIYEFKTCGGALAGGAIEPLLDAGGRMLPRPPLTKVLPNKLNNVLSAIKAPTLGDIRRSHARNHPNQVCEVCASI